MLNASKRRTFLKRIFHCGLNRDLFFRNIYTVSKPLLGLILLNENKFFTVIKQQLLYGHTQAKQAVLSTALDSLMTGIDRTLTEANKENFTQNMTQFRSDIQDSLNVHLPEPSPSIPVSSTATNSTNVPVTIAIANLIPSSSTTAPVEELMTL